MREGRRVWRVGKWVGVAACALIVAMWGWSVAVNSNNDIEYFAGSQMQLKAGRLIWRGLPRLPGTHIFYIHGGFQRAGFCWPWIGRNYFRQRVIVMPLWIPFVFAAIPTAVLWYGDRRRIPAGHCQRCRYDLTKNESGRCPECGVRFAREVTGEPVSR